MSKTKPVFKFTKKYDIQLAPTLNEHWYEISINNRKLGVVPSSTTILNAYPQSPHLTKWVGEMGWNEAERIKNEAGARGTRVHDAIEHLIGGDQLWKHSFSLLEWQKICSWVDWYNEVKPQILAAEVALYSPKYKYAGRVDCICVIDGKVVVVDWKTSASLYPHFPLQFASYAQALEEISNLKIDSTAGLQLGTSSKQGWKYDEHPEWKDNFKMFLTVKDVWEYDRFGSKKTKKKIEAPVLDLPDSVLIN